MEKNVVLIEFGHWYEIPTFYKFLQDEVIKKNYTPIFFTYDDIPDSIYRIWPFFRENKVFILKNFKNTRYFVNYIKERTVKTLFLKAPHRYQNLALLEFFTKLEVPSYTIITSTLGYKTYDSYFASEKQSTKQKGGVIAARNFLIIELIKDIFHRISVELTRFIPLLFALPLPKSYFIRSLRNYHQYVNENKSTYLVPSTEEVLILKKNFPNQMVERYTHPFVSKEKISNSRNSHYLFFIEFIESLRDVNVYVNSITELLLSKNVFWYDKIIFQFHPRQPLVYLDPITKILQSNFKNSTFGNNEDFYNLELILSKGKLMFSPVSTAVKLASFYRPNLKIIIYDEFLSSPSTRNPLAGTPLGPNVAESIKSHNLENFIF